MRKTLLCCDRSGGSQYHRSQRRGLGGKQKRTGQQTGSQAKRGGMQHDTILNDQCETPPRGAC